MSIAKFTTENTETEEWRDIVGYEGIYSISNFGRVRRDRPYRSTKAGYILKPQIRKGYCQILLSNGSGIRRTPFIHRLVAEAFIGPCPEGFQVNHKNGNKQTNNTSNLEYVTPHENVRHAMQTGLRGRGRAKLSVETAAYIREHYDPQSVDFNIKGLTKQFSIGKVTLWKIIKGRHWTSERPPQLCPGACRDY